MAPEKRQPDPALRSLLLERFHELSFFRAVQLVEMLCPGLQVGDPVTPAGEPVRFSVKPELRFPPSDICGVKESSDGGRVDMQVAFMGLFGANGPLPHWYTLLAAKEKGVSAFLDIFHHRLISLFFLAWRKSRFSAGVREGAKGDSSSYLLSLIGLGTTGLAERVGVDVESLAYFCGWLSRSPCSAAAVESTAGFLIGAPVRVEQLIEQRVEIGEDELTRLGMANCRMGVDAVCGHQAWESESGFRLCLGPLSYRQFLRLLPSGDMFAPLSSLVRFMSGPERRFEVRPILRRDEVPEWVIGRQEPDSPRLGWSTWLKPPGMALEMDPFVTFDAAG